MNSAITGFEGDTCPKCGMNLEPIAKQNAHSSHAHH
ncbi:hypothetical protein [Shewanella sp. WXL01]|nr:hypothetical protein [Shewanella maritima]